MATWTEIRLARLRLNDPADCVDIKTVTSLPTVPAYRTVYYLSSELTYHTHDGVGYVPAPIRAIDELISSWIDEYGTVRALVQGWKYLASKIGEEMRIESDTTGADSVKFTSLSSLLAFYKDQIAGAVEDAEASEEKSTGTYYQTKDPEIAGGLV